VAKRRRGGYTPGDRKHELKFRATPSLYQTLQNMADENQSATALLLRELVSEALKQREADSDRVPGR